MDCYHCGHELIWGGDHDLENTTDEHWYDVVTNLSCPNCGAYVEVYRPNYDHEDMTDEYDVVTNLSCPNCGAYVEVYRPNQEMKRERKLEEPSPTPDASWLDEIKTQDGE